MIRPADAARDASACAAIYAPFVTDGVESFEEVAPDAQEMARRIAAMPVWLVFEQAGEVAGYAYASPHRARPAYRWTVETSVYVDRAHHRQGIGRALYVALLEVLAEHGFHAALAGITLPNPASVALHERMGFEPTGVYREVGFKFGAWRDVGWWQRAIGA